MDYIVCWYDKEKGTNVWKEVESRREVASLLVRESIENDGGVRVFKLESDAEASIVLAEDIFAAL